MRCAAPWYELNVSVPDDRVSACCYYGGKTATQAETDSAGLSVAQVWNHGTMQDVRRINAPVPEGDDSGCRDCAYYRNRPGQEPALYADFEHLLACAETPAQRDNIRLAAREYAEGVVEAQSRPLRYYINFGFRCNIQCVMCLQLPRRQKAERGFSPELAERWWQDFQSALFVDVIGGEPFAIPSALSFIRRFVADPALAAVELRIFTNAQVLHKHLDMLQEKERIAFHVSIDSVGAGYETIRSGGTWAQLEANLLAALHLIRTERPRWSLCTNALMMRSGIPYLADYARFHVTHRIDTVFHLVWESRGVEEVTYREDVLNHPLLLNEVPGWRDHFLAAEAIFAEGGYPERARQLASMRATLEERLAAVRLCRDPVPGEQFAAVDCRDWTALDRRDGGMILPVAVETADGRPRFHSVDIHQAQHVRLPLPPDYLDRTSNGQLILRAFWPDESLAAGEVRCDLVFDARIVFEFVDWRQWQADGWLVKEMVLRYRDDATIPATFVQASLKTGAIERVNLLPHRLELYAVAKGEDAA